MRVTIPASVSYIGDGAFYECSDLASVVFKGNAPEIGYETFDYVSPDCTVYVRKGSTGWGVDIPGTWNGLSICYAEEGDGEDPIPDIGENPTAGQIEQALSGSADGKLVTSITNAASYQAYRAWAANVKTADGGEKAGAHAVKNAKNAWFSFAVDSDMLIPELPTSKDVKVDAFSASSESGKFDFTVSVDGVRVGSEALKENLKQVFGLEGATILDANGFSTSNVDIIFGTPENGKVKFTAGPNVKNADAKAFFMKVKLAP